ncbi:MAG: DUF2225 domain-containing protein [Ruminococcaceae bacterium]|nr:DUF2225 domain-containing protein [Oscillospiraceae bacterium]
MPKLKWKTKGNSNPQGKPRVYFCCHQDDFEKYFDLVYEEIMKNQNCAIYYDCEPEGEVTEEWLSYLGEMQLFVIPVTTKFLTKDNKGISTEFPFAEERHIPVLPLMQENGLDDVFSLKMGSLQYLNKYDEDKTGISYEEKLDKYLNSVLVGDELAQKIRDAFDAYIFLSYRKKDRVYAQQLMRLIHENEFCRDIAIWYDEFLTPGENFNDSIEEALKKSKLFALAVTPNLVNEENYVMNVEYPMAKGAGKTILPAEVVKTDRDELEKKYEGIPVCADAHNETELSRALLNALSGIAVRENDGDPKHNFFIGLAYLSGIDVEVNHERALRLISSAAESGLTEAMEKLVSMYRSGEGVERNYETAVEWQEKLVEVRRAEWESEQTEESAVELCKALWDLGYCCKDAYNNQKAFNSFAEMKDFSYKAFCILGSVRLIKYYGISCALIGDIIEIEGRIDEAKALYNKYLEVSEAALKTSGKIEDKRDIGISYERLADIYCKENNYDKAKELYMKAFKYCKDVQAGFDNFETRRDLSVICEKLGNVFRKKEDYFNAESLYLWALKINRLIFNELKTNKSKKEFANSYTKLADLFKAKGNNEKAKELYLKERKLREEIFVETDDTEYKIDLYCLYYKIADLSEVMGQSDEARDLFFKATRLAESFSELWPEDFMAIVPHSYNRFGELLKADGRIYKAREVYKKSLEIYESIFNKTKAADDYDDLAFACYRVASVEEGAVKTYYLQHAYEIWAHLSNECPNVAEYKRRRDIVANILSDR